MVVEVIERKVVKGVTKAARKLGCCQSHLSRVLRGERKPGKELVKRMRRMGIPEVGMTLGAKPATTCVK